MKKKIVAAALACVLCVGLGIGGTLAWLTAQTGPVTNTFTVGDIDLLLDEKDTDGSETGWVEGMAEGRDTQNAYDVIPGVSVEKDPTVHVLSGSEKCWVYVLVDDQMNKAFTNSAAYTVDAANWEQVKQVVNDNSIVTMYKYKTVVDAENGQVNLVVFNGVTISENITKADVDSLAGKTITVKAYAHQADNLSTDATNAMNDNAWAAMTATA